MRADSQTVATTAAAATPEQLLALKQADDNFTVYMAELKVSRDVVAAGDTANARAMAVSRPDYTAPAIAGAVVVGFFGLLLIVAFVPVPPNSANTLNLMLGSLSTAFAGVMGFYFGSSSGAKAKDELLFNSTPTRG